MTKSRIILFLLGFVLFFAFFLRVYKLDSVPNGLEQDETSIGYNAYSILKTGHDEYGKSYPLYFKAFGEYKLPVPVYLVSFSFSLLGVSEYSLRLPFALFGGATVFVIYFLAERLFRKKEVGIIAAALLAINPWHIHFSRGAFEVVPALFFVTCGIWLFLRFKEKNSYISLSLSLFLLVLSMYSYNIARLFVPLFIVAMTIYLRKEHFKVNSKKLCLSCVLPLIFIIPFVASLLSGGGVSSTKGTLIFSSKAVEAPLVEMRSYVFEKNPILSKLFFNKYILIGVLFFKNIVASLDFNFFFVNGSAHGNHGIGNIGQFYLWEVVSVMFGLVMIIRKKAKEGIILLIWLVLIIAMESLTREVPHATRLFLALPVIVIFSAYGVSVIASWTLSQEKLVKYLGVIIAGVVVFLGMVFYLSSYYFRFPIYYAKQWQQQDKALTKYLLENDSRYSEIVVDTKAGFIYTSYLFYSLYDPQTFHKKAERLPDDSEGFSNVKKIGKISYRDIDWAHEVLNNNTLFVTTPDNKQEGKAPVATFSYPKRPVVISSKEQLLVFPTTDIAYILYEGGK